MPAPDGSDLLHLDATAQAALVRSGQVSSLELVDAAIARIDATNDRLNAVIHPMFDSARAAARAIDAGGAEGPAADAPFRGVPMVVKDLACHTAGEPMCEGMRFLREAGWVEEHDTELAARFRRAGFVFLGKTNTPELGILPTTEPLAFGPTCNPWNLDHSTGGSSGGSAAAVAAGMVAVGHANDGGGSIRIPASACGLVGLKPTRGRTTQAPDYGDTMGGLICEHVVTRSVRDTAAVLDAVAGTAPGDPYEVAPPLRPWLAEVGSDPGRLRIGIMATTPVEGTAVHPDCAAAVEATGQLLESLGHTVESSYPAALDDGAYAGHFISMWAAGNAWSLDYWGRKVGRPVTEEDVEPLTWALGELGRGTTAAEWLASREWLQANARAAAAWWAEDGFDLLLTPTLAEPPPPLGEFDAQPGNPMHGLFRAASYVPFTPPFNVSGQPAISLPLAWNRAGLPIGSQLVASFGNEALLISVAAQLEAAQPWADRWPDL